jgi:hypothetical protein
MSDHLVRLVGRSGRQRSLMHHRTRTSAAAISERGRAGEHGFVSDDKGNNVMR